jgi:hypothetical protein
MYDDEPIILRESGHSHDYSNRKKKKLNRKGNLIIQISGSIKAFKVELPL